MQPGFPRRFRKPTTSTKPAKARPPAVEILEVALRDYRAVTERSLDFATRLTTLNYLLDQIANDTSLEEDQLRELVHGIAWQMSAAHDEAQAIYSDVDALESSARRAKAVA